jgi:hypothetical protein
VFVTPLFAESTVHSIHGFMGKKMAFLSSVEFCGSIVTKEVVDTVLLKD